MNLQSKCSVCCSNHLLLPQCQANTCDTGNSCVMLRYSRYIWLNKKAASSEAKPQPIATTASYTPEKSLHCNDGSNISGGQGHELCHARKTKSGCISS